jgi:hypothetical protein
MPVYERAQGSDALGQPQITKSPWRARAERAEALADRDYVSRDKYVADLAAAEADVARLREALEEIASPSVLSNKTQIIDAHRQIAKEALADTERRKDGEGNG